MEQLEQEKLDLLRQKVELKKQEYEKKGLFSLYHARFANDILKLNNYEAVNSICEMIDSWEGSYIIPYKVGISIDSFVNNPNLVVCIHRTKLQMEEKDAPINGRLKNIMEEGLINYGDVNAYGGSGFSNKIPDLIKTTTPLVGLSGYINFISSYHQNNVIVMMSFPKEFVSKHGEIIGDYSNVYDLSEKNPRVKPEYMMGAIVKDENGVFNFYTKDEIIAYNNQINR